MKAFAAPAVQSARNCRVKVEPGGSTPSAATGQLQCLSTELRIVQRALGN